MLSISYKHTLFCVLTRCMWIPNKLKSIKKLEIDLQQMLLFLDKGMAWKWIQSF